MTLSHIKTKFFLSDTVTQIGLFKTVKLSIRELETQHF
jgi:hypothetical protein